MDYLPVYTAIPFTLMLASIAILPMFAEHFWENNRNKLLVSLILGIPTAVWLILNGMTSHVEHSILFDYIPFIILLGSLFIITGGIFIDADFLATPKNNLLILATGGLLASFMGTTGAAMLLIRLLLHTNKQREHKTHTIVFFIFIVANCGGILTPLGDPPLFMMYLRGASFFWFFSMIKPWLFVNILLLTIFFILDNYNWNREKEENKILDKKEKTPMVVTGKINFLWLLVVILSVAFVNQNIFPFIKANPAFSFIRDAVILIAAILSLVTTKKELRGKNSFNWNPIKEVAYLFLGIFLTMVPVLTLLEQNVDNIHIESTTAFYYVTGALSSVLDNTPAAVTFYSLAKSLFSTHPEYISGEMVAGIPILFMEAICLGAVFFGAMTYIGNGPNFMVKSIAEQEGIKMPQFFQYIFKYSLVILLPVLILAHLLFI